jgi:hypothetical protein
MPKQVTQITVFISCPADVEEEKKHVKLVCDELNQVYRDRITLLFLDWKVSVIPEFGPTPQSIINDQIGEYDVYIGILWNKFGTPTGEINPETKEVYASGTEEEFYNAYNKWKDNGKPKINFYFKKMDLLKDDKESEQQIKVNNFKKRLQKELRGWIINFETPTDFEKEIRIFLRKYIKKVENKSPIPISEMKKPLPKKADTKIDYYLSRKVCSSEDYNIFSDIISFTEQHKKDLVEIVENKKRIILLSDAGVGKTIELKHLAEYYAKSNSIFFPMYITLNKFTKDITELFPDNWQNIPENQLLLILDGLDEIENQNRNTALRKIELFSEKHPESHILISCRTNFYKIESQKSSGTLQNFHSYILLNLNSITINKFIEDKLHNKAEEFKFSIYKTSFSDLLKIPFFLIYLIEIFIEKNEIPKNKAVFFETLLSVRINHDIEHYRTTIPLEDKKNIIFNTLEKVAISMETLCRNYITDDELQLLIPDFTTRKLISYCTAFKKDYKESITWQFEHNNFQELLAARVLSRQPLKIIKSFISFGSYYRKIIPSWVNTLSFLFGCIDKKNPIFEKLYNWILKIEPELIVKTEIDKIDLDVRIKIFKNIFNDYKLKKNWINHDKYKYNELAEFGQSDEIIKFLISEIINPVHYTTISNAINLLEWVNIPNSKKQLVRDTLLNCILNYEGERKEYIQNQVLFALVKLKQNTLEIINRILLKIRNSECPYVRYGMYYFLYTSDYLDENIDIFLEGLKFVESSNTVRVYSTKLRLLDERHHLIIGLKKVKSPEGIIKILKYFKDNFESFEGRVNPQDIKVIFENAIVVYKTEASILNLIYEVCLISLEKHRNNLKHLFINFFDETNNRNEIFKRILSKQNKSWITFNLLAELANNECIEIFINEYMKKNLSDKEVKDFQRDLFYKNKELCNQFIKQINEKTNNKFEIQILPARDFEKEQKERKLRDIQLIFNKAAYINEVKKIFTDEKKSKFTKEELYDLMNWDKPLYSDKVFYTLIKFSSGGPIVLENIINQINNRDWDLFIINEMYDLFNGTDVDLLSDKQIEWIKNWCYENYKKVDFKTSLITKEDGGLSANWNSIILWYFLRKLNLKFPKEVLLDMISFDWFEQNYSSVGIEYLENLIGKEEMSERIIENLNNGIVNDDVLSNHINYCDKYNIKEVASIIFQEIFNSKRKDDTREMALNAYIKLSNNFKPIENKLNELDEKFLWKVIVKLIESKSEYVEIYLLEILKTGNEDDKFRASEYLIILQNMKGLDYYVNWIKTNKKYWIEPHSTLSPLLSLKNIEVLPYLIDLLKINYDVNLIQNEFNNLERNVLDTLTKIALQSDTNYKLITEALNKFIKENSTVIKKINFMFIYLENLEQQYYVNKSNRYSVVDVLEKTKILI